MFKTVPKASEYEMSLDGNIRRKDGQECKLAILPNDEMGVHLELYGKHRIVSLEWLRLITYFEVELPEKIFFGIYFKEIFDWKYANAARCVMSFSGIPPEYKPGYRYVPNYTRYAVSKDGEVVDTYIGETLSHRHAEYITVLCYDPDKGKKRDVFVHRLVALAWVKNPDPKQFSIVNHIDGNKYNPRKDNLEWVDHSGNNDHAFLTGLRHQGVNCRVRNVETKEEFDFPLLRLAAEHMEVQRSELTLHLNKNPMKLIKGKYEIRIGDDETEWLYDEPEIHLGYEAYKSVLTDKSGIKKTFYGAQALSDFLGVKMLRGDVMGKAKALAKEQGYEIEVCLLEKKDKTIQSYCVATGEILEHAGVKPAARHFKIPRNAVKYALAKGEQYISKGYAFRYKTDKPWNTQFIEYANRPRCIVAVSKKGDKVIECKSIREAERLTGVTQAIIANCLRNVANNFRWHFKYKE